MSNSENIPSDVHIINNSALAIQDVQSSFEHTTKDLTLNVESRKIEITPHHFSDENGFFKNAFFDAINGVEKEIIREKNFSSETNAQLFFQKAKDVLSLIKERQKEAIDSFQFSMKKEDKEEIKFDDFWMVNPLLLCTFLLSCYFSYLRGEYVFNEWNSIVGFWNVLNSITSPIGIFGISFFLLYISSVMVSYPFYFLVKKRKFKKIDNKTYDLPLWIKFLDSRLISLTQIMDGALQESLNSVRENKALKIKINHLEIEDRFNEKISTRSLSERLAIIQKELDAAILTTANLNEQHRLTEEIRLKYAKELVDIQRQVKHENNQDLFAKMAMVNDLLGDTP